jgi:sn-glycerol 3-phosphate transport system permease protein
MSTKKTNNGRLLDSPSAGSVERHHGPFSRRNLVATLTKGYLPLLIAVLVMGLPLLWMVVSSFKPLSEVIALPIQWIPHKLQLHNYVEASHQVPFARDFLNSVIVTFFGAGIKVVLAMMTAYALVFVRFPFKRIIFLLILATLMVPPQVAIVPNYVLISGWGGNNTYWGIILPGLGSGFGTFLLRQNFLTIPRSILEAAALDGAGHWRRLWRVVTPVTAPAIATVSLVSIVYEWNNYIWPLVIVDDPHMMTLPVGLTLLQNIESKADSYGLLMAGSTLVIIPVLIVFAMLQRYIVSGLTQGAVAGE